MKEFKNIQEFALKNKNKSLFSISLHGLNHYTLNKIELLNGFSKRVKLSNISAYDLVILKNQLLFFYDLEKNKIFKNILKYKKIKNYRGMRHILRLPIRGQRTHTNAKTIKKYTKKEL